MLLGFVWFVCVLFCVFVAFVVCLCYVHLYVCVFVVVCFLVMLVVGYCCCCVFDCFACVRCWCFLVVDLVTDCFPVAVVRVVLGCFVFVL